MNTVFRLIAIVFLLLGQVQQPEYRLDLRRNFGYGAGSNVQGDFTNRVYGPEENIASVTYRIDDQIMAEVTEPPFELNYKTGSYAPGPHNLTAVVKTKDGREVNTQTIYVNFLSAEQAGQDMMRIFGPLIGVILLITIVGVGMQVISARRNPASTALGAHRNYGFLGGTICPRCGRPYPLHWWGFKVLVGRIERCDYCGKWALVTRKPPEILAAAEEIERAAAARGESALPGLQNEETEEERMRKMLDESRYTE